MYFPDLSPYEYFVGFQLPNVRNVGWLDAMHSYAQGEVSLDFPQKLRAVIAGTAHVDVHVNQIRGIHPCNFCGEDRVALTAYGNRTVMLGSSEIWVPSENGDIFFAAPSMILHYIEHHRYLPPQPYVRAVMAMSLTATFNAQAIYEEIYCQERTRVGRR